VSTNQCYDEHIKNTILQILGFALMVLGIQGAIVLASNDNAGLLSWMNLDTSLAMAAYIVIALGGMYLLSWAQKQSKKK